MISVVVARIAAHIRIRRDPVAYFRAQGARIGTNVTLIGPRLATFGSEPYLITIGDNVTVSSDASFVTHDGGLRVVRHRRPDAYYYSRIKVCDRVFIGAGAMILPGVTIGAGAVVGARAVVANDVEPNTVVAGVPARVIKNVSDYVAGHERDWIDTSGLSPRQKRAVLESSLGRD